MTDYLPPRTDILDQILDRVHPPVARLRIISNGLAQNHTLKTSDDLSGTRACLSCGNCVDACPVVAGKPEGVMFVRTSMLLENVVAEECRRCYRCVAACPQVNRPLKDYGPRLPPHRAGLALGSVGLLPAADGQRDPDQPLGGRPAR
ncbi:MAG: 4Fe-4S dicluster domain-containing protein [Chloroflexi bacterium]|nr:4Fe-4S dicluster domain-containing protein [Chloroflexota bacterium]